MTAAVGVFARREGVGIGHPAAERGLAAFAGGAEGTGIDVADLVGGLDAGEHQDGEENGLNHLVDVRSGEEALVESAEER